MKQKLHTAHLLLLWLASLLLAGGARADGAVPPPPSPTAAPARASLYVKANGFKGTQGQALVALYSSKSTWLKIDRADKLVKAKITGASLTIVFGDLAPGDYAVSVIHDANANGKLDMHWFPIPGPDEGAGVSNDASATFGPPSYEDARFHVGGSTGVIDLKVRY